MMGNLFYRGVCPSIIKKMGYLELKYWSRWHDIMAEQEKKAIPKPKGT